MGAGAVRDQAGHKRSYAAMLAHSLDVKRLKEVFREQEHTRNFNCKKELLSRYSKQASNWHFELRCGVG